MSGRGLGRSLVPVVLLAAGATVLASGSAPRREVLVFAAASLSDALREIGTAFERNSGVRVLCSFAGSNDLARQIRAGAPADVFVSASRDRMDELEEAGLLRQSDRFDLLANGLVVIASARVEHGFASPRDLLRVRRIALGDPWAVPAGIYARLWLERAGLWSRLEERVVPTLDVRAALTAVDSGAAEAGIVYRTDARMARNARVVLEVPASEAPPIVYPAAVLRRSSGEGRLFLDHLRSPESRAVFERLGFEVLVER